MNVLGLIPARGGSRRVPRKNIKPLGPLPLFLWTVEAARASECFRYPGRIAVSTEDVEIAVIAMDNFVKVVPRPREMAADEATLYPVMLHALDWLKDDRFDAVVLLHPTSPLRDAHDIDSFFAAWIASNKPAGYSVNEPYKRANAALYACTVEWLKAGGHFDHAPDAELFRWTMPNSSHGLDIDTPEDWAVAEYAFAKNWHLVPKANATQGESLT